MKLQNRTIRAMSVKADTLKRDALRTIQYRQSKGMKPTEIFDYVLKMYSKQIEEIMNFPINTHYENFKLYITYHIFGIDAY